MVYFFVTLYKKMNDLAELQDNLRNYSFNFYIIDI